MNPSAFLPPFSFLPGSTPLLLSVPHAGLELLPGMANKLTPEAACLPDTDWCVDELYAWAAELGVGLLVAKYSRYVVDLNRPADDASLYVNQATGLFPQQTFAGQPLWQEAAQASNQAWIVENIWQPYHQKIATELQQLKTKFGYAMLLDAHSIAPMVPALFSGQLPDFNLGSFAGASAAPELIHAVWESLEHADYSRVLDGRFKGGAITRGFGDPAANIHALQLELSQSTYMSEQAQIDMTRAEQIKPVLVAMVTAMLNWQGRVDA